MYIDKLRNWIENAKPSDMVRLCIEVMTNPTLEMNINVFIELYTDADEGDENYEGAPIECFGCLATNAIVKLCGLSKAEVTDAAYDYERRTRESAESNTHYFREIEKLSKGDHLFLSGVERAFDVMRGIGYGYNDDANTIFRLTDIRFPQMYDVIQNNRSLFKIDNNFMYPDQVTAWNQWADQLEDNGY